MTAPGLTMDRHLRHTLQTDLAALANAIRYDGLLPSSGIAIDGDLFENGEALTRDSVLEVLHTLVADIDIETDRRQLEALLNPDPEVPALATDVGDAEVDTVGFIETQDPNAPEATHPDTPAAGLESSPWVDDDEPEALAAALLAERSESQVDFLPETFDGDEPTQPELFEVEIIAEVNRDLGPAHQVDTDDDLGSSAAPTEPPDVFELAQTVTAQLMNRLDATLAGEFPGAVYDTFAEVYFQFSARVCERLADAAPDELLKLMGQEAARDAG